MKSSDPTELDQILALAELAGTEHARRLLRHIREAVEGGADVVPWVSAVQLARSLAAIDDTAAHYLIHILTEASLLRSIDTDDVLTDLQTAMDALERANGLEEGDYYRVDEAPANWQALHRKWEQRFDVLHAQLLRELGEHQLAHELLLRPDECHRRTEEGRRAMMDVSDDRRP